MSLFAMCRECNTQFRKYSIKSREDLCHKCKGWRRDYYKKGTHKDVIEVKEGLADIKDSIATIEAPIIQTKEVLRDEVHAEVKAHMKKINSSIPKHVKKTIENILPKLVKKAVEDEMEKLKRMVATVNTRLLDLDSKVEGLLE